MNPGVSPQLPVLLTLSDLKKNNFEIICEISSLIKNNNGEREIEEERCNIYLIASTAQLQVTQVLFCPTLIWTNQQQTQILVLQEGPVLPI